MASACSSLKPPSRWSRRNASCVSMSVGIEISEPFKKRCCSDTFVNGQVSEQAKSEARIQHRKRKSGTVGTPTMPLRVPERAYVRRREAHRFDTPRRTRASTHTRPHATIPCSPRWPGRTHCT
jgi:hypothetical protein